MRHLFFLLVSLSITAFPAPSSAQRSPTLQEIAAKNDVFSLTPDIVEHYRKRALSAGQKGLTAGMRKLAAQEVKALLVGRSIRTYYLHSDDVFDYWFEKRGTVIRRRLSDQAGGLATWRPDGERLCIITNTPNCYTYYSNGGMYVAERTTDGKTYWEIFRGAADY